MQSDGITNMNQSVRVAHLALKHRMVISVFELKGATSGEFHDRPIIEPKGATSGEYLYSE